MATDTQVIRCDFGNACPGHASPDERPCGWDNTTETVAEQRARKSATPAPAGDAEVSHEQAREIVQRLIADEHAWRGYTDLLEYISQQEARQQQAEQRISEYKASEADWRESLRIAESVLKGKDEAIAELTAKLDTVHSALWDPFLSTDSKRMDKIGGLFSGPPPARNMGDALNALADAVIDNPIISMECDLAGALGLAPAAKDWDAMVAMVEDSREQRDELSRKLEAAERELSVFKADSLGVLTGEDAVAFEQLLNAPAKVLPGLAEALRKRRNLATPPDQPPPAKPKAECVHRVNCATCGASVHPEVCTPDDVRSIARAVVAEVAERAADDRLHPGAAPLRWLAEAAKEESGG